MTDIQIFKPEHIKNLIYTIRGEQVMLDRDLAQIYAVETKVLNQAVKRNIERFPNEYRFQISKEELESLKSQIVISDDKSLRSQIVTTKKTRGGSRYLPYAFTEQGVAMLSAVLKSDTAVKVSMGIMNAFVTMRKFIWRKILTLPFRVGVKCLKPNRALAQ